MRIFSISIIHTICTTKYIDMGNQICIQPFDIKYIYIYVYVDYENVS